MSKVIVAGVLGVIVGAGAGYYVAQRNCPLSAGCAITEKHCAVRRGMDRLWADHVVWTRQFIVAALAGMADADTAVARLMKNQEDIGNAIAPFYGADVAKKLTELLKLHITIAADLVKALKAGDQDGAKTADKAWHDNVVEIATFLSDANPNWTKEGLIDMLNTHLDLTSQEVAARLKSDWSDDAREFDEILTQILMMSKLLSDGITKQFPEKI